VALGQRRPVRRHLANENPAGQGTFKYALRFPGQYYDTETGTNYNVNRDYDSATGRYIESDPMGLQGGVATYAYVDNAPVGYIDPSGLQAIAPPGGGLGGLGGLGGFGACCGTNQGGRGGRTGNADLDRGLGFSDPKPPAPIYSTPEDPFDAINGGVVPPYPGLKDLGDCASGRRLIEAATRKQPLKAKDKSATEKK
jgi:RHS repeat-associated protein